MTPNHHFRNNPIIAFWRKIGGGSLALSIAIHAGIVLVAMFIIKSSLREPKIPFLPGGGNKGAQEARKALSEQVKVNRSARREKAEMARITSNVPHPDVLIAEKFSDIPPQVGDDDLLQKALGGSTGGFGTKGTGGGSGIGDGIGGLPGMTWMPTTYKNRCGGWQDRLKKLKDNGGNDQCEKAVSNSLAWLKEHQNVDGSWGKTHTGAMTGLALLCYLGRCETPDSTFYGDTVMKGILYLVELSHSNKSGMMSKTPTSGPGTYEHGIATYALGEMYALARMGSKSFPGMKEAYENGVKLIIENQGASGGWGYGGTGDVGYNKTGNDLSVTGWQYQALKAAKLSGLKMEGLHSAIEKAVKNLESKQTKDGGFGNANREQGYNQWNLTGTGLLGLQTLGNGRHKTEIKKGLMFAQTYFAKEPPRWDKNANLYAWYYYNQVFFQSGGDSWKKWNEAVLPEILSHQAKDGGWTNETFDSQIGSTATAGADHTIYRTALCTLMLEVYFRYLRVGDREEGSIFERKSAG